MKVSILGASGMLGAMVLDVLARETDWALQATVRRTPLLEQLENRLPAVEFRLMEAGERTVADLAHLLEGVDWAINAIGLIKPYIKDQDPESVQAAVRINTLFPAILGKAARQAGCRVLQIATDCVYSGSRGDYVETDAHDALDVYGKTKSLGEMAWPSVHHLRCSIVGPEIDNHRSLLDWFLGQPQDSRVNGYRNHRWNGLTTLHFARLCRGIIAGNLSLPRLQHLLPERPLSKAELLDCFGRSFGRQDITIVPTDTLTAIDRSLATNDEQLNRRIWAAAGYAAPPTIGRMVAELAAYELALMEKSA